MTPVHPRESGYHTLTLWVPTTKQCRSQELRRSNQCRQLLGCTFHEGLRAAAVSVLMSLHVKGMCIPALIACITLKLLDRPKPAALLLGNFLGCSVGEGGSLWSGSPGREPVQSFVSWDHTAFLAAKLGGHLQSPALAPTPAPCAHTGSSVTFNSYRAANLIQS